MNQHYLVEKSLKQRLKKQMVYPIQQNKRIMPPYPFSHDKKISLLDVEYVDQYRIFKKRKKGRMA